MFLVYRSTNEVTQYIREKKKQGSIGHGASIHVVGANDVTSSAETWGLPVCSNFRLAGIRGCGESDEFENTGKLISEVDPGIERLNRER